MKKQKKTLKIKLRIKKALISSFYAQRKFKDLKKYESLENYAYLKLVRVDGRKLN